MSESNMELICKDIVRDIDCNGKKHSIKTKKWWDEFELSNLDISEECFNKERKDNAKKICEPYENWHEPKSGRLSTDKTKDIGNLEIVIEKYICKANENMSLHWQVGARSGEAVDLVYSHNDEYSLIELKILRDKKSKSDNPVIAFVEILKYFYCIQNYCNNNKKSYNIKELCLLATQDYFEYFYNEKSCNNFFAIIENFYKKYNQKNTIPPYKIYCIKESTKILRNKCNDTKKDSNRIRDKIVEKLEWEPIENQSDWEKVAANRRLHVR